MPETHPSDTLKDIKQMMERSSRFISLSGLSGISAGCCALVGAWFAQQHLLQHNYKIIRNEATPFSDEYGHLDLPGILNHPLFMVAITTFAAAFILAFLFTYWRSKKNDVAIWGLMAQRLMLSVSLPMMVGGLFLLKLIDAGFYGMIAPGSLIFYGLAILNASKYTFPETQYLAYAIIITGVICLWFLTSGIYFWAFGFGICHIIYGAAMWYKYERN